MTDATVVQQQQPGGIQADGAQRVVVVVAAGGQSAPPGVQGGGQWVQDKYCGPVTWLLGIFLLLPTFCCPCDSRMVYVINGAKYNAQGKVASLCC